MPSAARSRAAVVGPLLALLALPAATIPAAIPATVPTATAADLSLDYEIIDVEGFDVHVLAGAAYAAQLTSYFLD